MKSLLWFTVRGVNRETHERIKKRPLENIVRDGVIGATIPTREDTSDRGCIPAGLLALRHQAFIESAFPGFPSGLTAQ